MANVNYCWKDNEGLLDEWFDALPEQEKSHLMSESRGWGSLSYLEKYQLFKNHYEL